MRLNHIAVVVKDVEESIRYYKICFGFSSDGVIYEDLIQRVRISFVKLSDQDLRLELLEPMSGDSPVMNALRKGGGLNHICYEVQNIGQAIQLLLEKGSRLISGPTPAIAFQNRSIAFIYTKQGEVVELLEA